MPARHSPQRSRSGDDKLEHAGHRQLLDRLDLQGLAARTLSSVRRLRFAPVSLTNSGVSKISEHTQDQVLRLHVFEQ